MVRSGRPTGSGNHYVNDYGEGTDHGVGACM